MTAADDLGFRHAFRPGAAGAPALLLLHGTGGDETDLVPLAGAVMPAAAILSPRGNVLENGMPRFFRRFAEGRFDLDDVARQADALAAFVAAAGERYRLSPPLALGFSNGANIAAAMMLRHPNALAGAALVRAQPTLLPDAAPDLSGRPVLILSGAMDPIVPEAESARLAEAFRTAGADVTHETLPAGHGLTQGDVDRLRDWFAGPGAAGAGDDGTGSPGPDR